ncbi:MAG: hypothetical protein GF317_19345 [Candidatus Lokiarchaeota archaeon]|nr:hypothetical protein [Candidatus Lokiarchaeota archaeon]MBD3201654.1 hypothetical protein [Candidatus Lokiarchaeota archaeon]
MSEKIQKKSNNEENIFRKLITKLTNPFLLKFCIYGVLIVFIPGLIIGVIIAYFFGPESYNIWNNYISDLGSYNYTPAPFILDYSAMITSFLLIPIFVYLTSLLYETKEKPETTPKKILDIILKIDTIFGLFFLLLAVVGFFGIGLFSEDRTTELGLHYFFSIVVFGSFVFAAWFDGFVIMVKKTSFYRIIGLFMFIATPTMGILFVINPPSLTKPFMEWMLFISIAVWLLPIIFIILKKYIWK